MADPKTSLTIQERIQLATRLGILKIADLEQRSGLTLDPTTQQEFMREAFNTAGLPYTANQFREQAVHEREKDEGALENFAKAGFKSLTGTAIGVVGSVAPDLGKSLSDASNVAFGESSGVSGFLGETVGQAAASITALTGVGLAGLGASAAGHSRIDVNRRRLLGEQIGLGEELANAAAHGVAELLFERVLGRTGLEKAGKAFQTAIPKLTQGIRRRSASAIKQALKQGLPGVAAASTQNAIEEALTSVANDFSSKYITDEDISTQDFVNNAAVSALQGAFAPVIAGPLVGTIRRPPIRGSTTGKKSDVPSPESDPDVVAVASEYIEGQENLRDNFIEIVEDDNPARQSQIAVEYEQSGHHPDNAEVQQAYGALVVETNQQVEAMKKAGVEIEIWPDDSPPYTDQKQMQKDIHNNNHIWVSANSDIPADHPLAAQSKVKDANGMQMTESQVLEAAHQYFGFAAGGFGNGAAGSHSAWEFHRQMYSPEAARALATETIGQRSWEYYGPLGLQNRADPANLTPAEGKATLLPDWVSDPAATPPPRGEMDVGAVATRLENKHGKERGRTLLNEKLSRDREARDPKSSRVQRGVDTLSKRTKWNGGRAYSAGALTTAKGHHAYMSAADVVVEMRELGFTDDLTADELTALETQPADSVEWITQTQEEAAELGVDVDLTTVPAQSIVIADDASGGMLVLKTTETIPSGKPGVVTRVEGSRITAPMSDPAGPVQDTIPKDPDIPTEPPATGVIGQMGEGGRRGFIGNIVTWASSLPWDTGWYGVDRLLSPISTRIHAIDKKIYGLLMGYELRHMLLKARWSRGVNKFATLAEARFANEATTRGATLTGGNELGAEARFRIATNRAARKSDGDWSEVEALLDEISLNEEDAVELKQEFRKTLGVLEDIKAHIIKTDPNFKGLVNFWPAVIKSHSKFLDHVATQDQVHGVVADVNAALADIQKDGHSISAADQIDIARNAARNLGKPASRFVDAMEQQVEALGGRPLSAEQLAHLARQQTGTDGAVLGEFEQAFARASRGKERPLKAEERKEIINRLLQFRSQGSGNFLAHRTNAMDRRNYQLYDTSLSALHGYISRAAAQVAKRELFGVAKKRKAGEEAELDTEADLSDDINALIDRRLQERRLTPKQQKALKSMIQARFSQGDRSPGKTVRAFRDLAHVAVLANPMAAIIQGGDLLISAALNGWIPALVGTGHSLPGIRSVLGSRTIRLEDLGLDDIGAEFMDPGVLTKFADTMMGAAGFSTTDRFGKTAIINAAYVKIRHMVKTKEGIESLREKYGEIMPNELEAALDFAKTDDGKGEMSDEMRLVLFHELSQIQPISRLEVPETYLRFPNGRMFYTFKTFWMKELDLMRRKNFAMMRDGMINNDAKLFARGSVQVLRMGVFLVMAGAGTDWLNRFLLGRPLDFPDRVVDATARLAGFSSYYGEVATQQGLGHAGWKFLMPPIGAPNDLSLDLWNHSDIMELRRGSVFLRNLPVIGKIMYWRTPLGQGSRVRLREFREKTLELYAEAVESGHFETANAMLRYHNALARDSRQNPLTADQIEAFLNKRFREEKGIKPPVLPPRKLFLLDGLPGSGISQSGK